MGDLINRVEIFKMRRLKADIERAGNGHFHEEFAKTLKTTRMPSLTWGTSIIERYKVAINQARFNEALRNIILPTKPEGHLNG